MAPPPAAPVVDVGAVALLNPLVSAASPLLGLIASLRQATQAPQVPALRASLVAAVIGLAWLHAVLPKTPAR